MIATRPLSAALTRRNEQRKRATVTRATLQTPWVETDRYEVAEQNMTLQTNLQFRCYERPYEEVR